jgi:hypothetical protein
MPAGLVLFLFPSIGSASRRGGWRCGPHIFQEFQGCVAGSADLVSSSLFVWLSGLVVVHSGMAAYTGSFYFCLGCFAVMVSLLSDRAECPGRFSRSSLHRSGEASLVLGGVPHCVELPASQPGRIQLVGWLISCRAVGFSRDLEVAELYGLPVWARMGLFFAQFTHSTSRASAHLVLVCGQRARWRLLAALLGLPGNSLGKLCVWMFHLQPVV